MNLYTIHALIDSGLPTVFYITGGGSGAISQLLEQGGGSSFCLDAQVPYDNQCIIELLDDYKPDKFCSEETSRMLAVCAYKRAVKLTGSLDVVGVGSTAKLHKLHDERDGREHVIHVSIHSKSQTRTVEALLNPACNYIINNRCNAETRKYEEKLATNTILQQYCNFFKIYDQDNYYYFIPYVAEVTSQWHCHLTHEYPRHAMSIREGECVYNPFEVVNPVIFSGSFNPVHDGHIKIVEKAYELLHKPVWFEISLENCDKPPVDWISLEKRTKGFDKHKDNPAIAGFIFTQAPLFVQKARLFHEPVFLAGSDTISRLDNPMYYKNRNDYVDSINELVSRKAQLLVFDRPGDIKLPIRHRGLAKICTMVEDYEPITISSTEIRNKE